MALTCGAAAIALAANSNTTLTAFAPTGAPATRPRAIQSVALAASPGSKQSQFGSEDDNLLDNLAERFGAQELAQEVFESPDVGKRGEEYFVAQLVALLFLVFTPAFLNVISSILGVAFLLGGLAVVVVGLNDLGRSLSPLPQPRASNQLVTTGLYEYARHPMYAGLLIAATGLAALASSPAKTLLVWVLFFVLDKKAALEEDSLMERHGAAYKGYMDRVAKFFPYLY